MASSPAYAKNCQTLSIAVRDLYFITNDVNLFQIHASRWPLSLPRRSRIHEDLDKQGWNSIDYTGQKPRRSSTNHTRPDLSHHHTKQRTGRVPVAIVILRLRMCLASR